MFLRDFIDFIDFKEGAVFVVTLLVGLNTSSFFPGISDLEPLIDFEDFKDFKDLDFSIDLTNLFDFSFGSLVFNFLYCRTL